MHKVPVPLSINVLYKITSEYMGTPEKRTPQLPVTHNLHVRFADKNSVTAKNAYMLIFIYLYDIGAFMFK